MTRINAKDPKLAEMFDLSAFDTVTASDRGAECELVHLKTGEPTGIFFKVLGSDSTEWREHVNAKNNKRLLADFQAKRNVIKSKNAPTIEDVHRDAIELLTLCTVGWRTVVNDESKPVLIYRGEELAFNSGNVERIYTELPSVYEQIDNFIGDMANFI